MQIRQFSCLEDNYGYLVHEESSGETWCIDSPDPAVILRELANAGWTLTAILNTHHHDDHVGGNEAIKAATGCQVIGPAGHASKVPGIDRMVGDGDLIGSGAHPIQVLDIPGHTRGHVSFWFADEKCVFVGDTLFPLGCGRLFGGTYEQMYASLSRLAALPGDTRVYCSHEYSLGNLRYALGIEKDNMQLFERGSDILAKRARGEPTVPSTIEEERATNPFLRADQPSVAAALRMPDAGPVEVLKALRDGKDKFS